MTNKKNHNLLQHLNVIQNMRKIYVNLVEYFMKWMNTFFHLKGKQLIQRYTKKYIIL
jgi:hypothetical protein